MARRGVGGDDGGRVGRVQGGREGGDEGRTHLTCGVSRVTKLVLAMNATVCMVQTN